MKSVRLPLHIKPISYKLQIRPDMEAFTFSGEETIQLTVDKAGRTVTLHSRDIEILDGWYQTRKDKLAIQKITYQVKDETATLHFAKPIPKGKGKLFLHFRGIIADSLRGFYRSHYMHEGQERRIATTQFESTDARRAFPCFDEPAHKATFELSLVIPKHLTAISNTIEQNLQQDFSESTPSGLAHDPGYKVINFAPTPKMSTYLLAYIIGEFEKSEIKTKDGVKIRIYTPLGKKHQTKFALDVTKRSLEFLNEYFAIPYPLPVLDLIALPDFASGAMENWGAITFRETALLVDEEHTAFANKQHIAETIAHELVHQWFGNLVTMEWWSYLWLNESFASFMSYIVIDDLFPEWNFWTRFVLHDHANALHLDSLKNTHPIEIEVHHPDQISEIFDAISYDKGASVLRMLYHYLGPADFRDGLRHYLKKHSYNNTSSIHLWEAFEKVSKKPVQKFITPWLTKEGYPLLKVEETKTGVAVEQSRFGLSKNIQSTMTWPVPVQFQLKKGEFSNLELLTGKRNSFAVNGDAQYLKSNPNETGFYRTFYSARLLAKLYKPVKNQELGINDRFGIIRDLNALVISGHLPTTAYLEFMQAYQNEDSYIIWAEICSGLAYLYNSAQDYPKLQKALAKKFKQFLKPAGKLVGWAPQHKETNARGMLRSLILTQLGLYGDGETLTKAGQIFTGRNRKPITPDLRSVVYTLTAQKGDSKTFSTLLKMIKAEKFPEEHRRLTRAIVAFENKALFKKVLDLILSKHIRPQDATVLIYQCLSFSHYRELTWQWIQKNWQVIAKRYHKDHLLVYIFMGLGGFANLDKAKEIREFFKKNPAPSAERSLRQALEKIEINSAWIERDKKDIAKHLGIKL